MPRPQFKNQKFEQLNQILRVDHAGEYAACKICEGQIAGSSSNDKEKFFTMLQEERLHLSFFNNELVKRGVRPTILMPIWDKLSYALGYLSAKHSLKSGMLATEAIESVIEKHYEDQIPLLNDDKELQDKIQKFKEDETHHKQVANAHYNLNNLNMMEKAFFKFVKASCRIAIFLSTRV